MTNADIASAFDRIAKLLSLQDANPFRIRAYDRASQVILTLSKDLSEIVKEGGRDGLLEIPGIGQDLADKIMEMLETGKLEYLKEMQKEIPPGLLEITEIQGMGPKKTKFVYEKFKVKSIADLEKLVKSGKLNTLKGWGDKSVHNILLGIESKKSHGERVALPIADALALQLLAELRETKLCIQLEIAGSLRRRRESIGDIDVLASSLSPARVMDAFCESSLVERVLAKGETRASVVLKSGLNADLRVIDSTVFGAALHYFTGSKDHNVSIRQLGIMKGVTISEYGVYKGTAEQKGKLLASKTEEDIYKAVGLQYVPPELRENRGEIELAKKNALPTLIEEKDVKGDLHLHSNFSDGSASMIEMAKAAKDAGHEYIAITDHGSPMGMVYGIKKNNIKQYLKMIDEARAKVPGIHILSGTEVDILEDGSLYLDDSILAQLDWVVASIHNQFKLTPKAMTERLIRAIENPHVNLIAHPTSRKLLLRDPIEYDIDAVFKAAKKHGVALELNASIERLDLNDILCKRAKDMGIKICIDSDAHNPRDFQYQYGISQARRGWLTKDDVLNTMSWKKFEAYWKN